MPVMSSPASPTATVTPTNFDSGTSLVYPRRSFLPLNTPAIIDFLSAALPRAPAFV